VFFFPPPILGLPILRCFMRSAGVTQGSLLRVLIKNVLCVFLRLPCIFCRLISSPYFFFPLSAIFFLGPLGGRRVFLFRQASQKGIPFPDFPFPPQIFFFFPPNKLRSGVSLLPSLFFPGVVFPRVPFCALRRKLPCGGQTLDAAGFNFLFLQ